MYSDEEMQPLFDLVQRQTSLLQAQAEKLLQMQETIGRLSALVVVRTKQNFKGDATDGFAC